MYIVILTSFYTANLTAFMTFNGLKLPITSVGDFETYGRVTWLAKEDEAIEHFIDVKKYVFILIMTNFITYVYVF